MTPSIKVTKNLCLSFLFAVCAACASSSNETKSDETTPALKAEPKEQAPEPRRGETRGKNVFVTTTLANENVMEGSLSSGVLSESLMSIDDLARKESDNVPLIVTYLGLLRLHGQNPTTYLNYQRQAGAAGAKNVWFLLEAGYGALRRKDYGLADYLFSKADKASAGSAVVKNAVEHAFAIRQLMLGKTQTGIAQLRKVANSSTPYLPTALTLGFLALKAGDMTGGEKLFRTATSNFPSSVNAKLGLAASLRARGKADEALPIVESIYKTRPQDRRAVWNYALVVADIPEKKQEALDVLNKYFQLPGTLPDIDGKANALIAKLQRAAPPPAPKQEEGTAKAQATAGGAAHAESAKTAQGTDEEKEAKEEPKK